MRNIIVEWDLDTAQWIVREEGQKAPIAAADTQEEAIADARTLRGSGGGQIKVRQLNGQWSDASE